MKKLFVCVATTLLIVACAPIQSNAASESNLASVSLAENESAEMKALVNRVGEINAMDRSAMSASEKKALRKEARAMKKDIKKATRQNSSGGGGVYLSVGALLLIILLIILI